MSKKNKKPKPMFSLSRMYAEKPQERALSFDEVVEKTAVNHMVPPLGNAAGSARLQLVSDHVGDYVEVPLVVGPNAAAEFCHDNVAQRVVMDGGAQVTGWRFYDRGFELVGELHSVWRKVDGTLEDITPLRTLTNETHTLFVECARIGNVSVNQEDTLCWDSNGMTPMRGDDGEPIVLVYDKRRAVEVYRETCDLTDEEAKAVGLSWDRFYETFFAVQGQRDLWRYLRRAPVL